MSQLGPLSVSSSLRDTGKHLWQLPPWNELRDLQKQDINNKCVSLFISLQMYIHQGWMFTESLQSLQRGSERLNLCDINSSVLSWQWLSLLWLCWLSNWGRTNEGYSHPHLIRCNVMLSFQNRHSHPKSAACYGARMKWKRSRETASDESPCPFFASVLTEFMVATVLLFCTSCVIAF